MSENKHTPGPWKITYRSFDRTNIRIQIEHVTESKASPVAFVEIAKRYEWGESDANLMAASPDLLEACEAVVAFFEDMGEPIPPCAQSARAAIAKARGE